MPMIPIPETITIHVPSTPSTNDFLRAYKGTRGSLMTVAYTDRQTAGRGRGTHTWESEPGKNLTASIAFEPQCLPANRQFAVLQAMAFATLVTIGAYIDEPRKLAIKWPNDIYYNDSKISGTLSECEVSGFTVRRCIVGIGININQTEFRSDAPNPISIANIRGFEANIDHVLKVLINNARTYINKLNDGDLAFIDQLYRDSLYRRHGMHCYQDKDGRFTARIAGIKTTGHIVLQKAGGAEQSYGLGEVKAILTTEPL